MIGIGSLLLFSTVGESGQIEVAVFTTVLSLGDDNINGKLNPTPVRTTIEFRGKQVRVCSAVHLPIERSRIQGNIYFSGWRYHVVVVRTCK